MHHDPLAANAELWKKIDAQINPKWMKSWEDITKLKGVMSPRVLAEEDLRRQLDSVGTPWWMKRNLMRDFNALTPTFSEHPLQKIGQLLKSKSAFEQASNTFSQLAALANLQTQAQKQLDAQLAHWNPRTQLFPAPASIIGSTGLAEMLTLAPSIAKATAGITQAGRFSAILGPQVGVLAGLYGYTKTENERTEVTPERSMQLISEAREQLRAEPEFVRSIDASDPSNVELIEELEAFFLPTSEARKTYEAATRELAIEPLDKEDLLGARFALVITLFLCLYVSLMLTSSKPMDQIALQDHVTAATDALAITGAISGGVYAVNQRQRRPGERPQQTPNGSTREVPPQSDEGDS